MYRVRKCTEAALSGDVGGVTGLTGFAKRCARPGGIWHEK